MRTLLVSVLSIFALGNSYAQKEKVKGNKIVMTEEKIIEAFHTIELYDNFEVTLSEDTDNIIKIEADSNLQEFITYDIQDSILKLKASKSLKRAKKLNVKISYASALKKIAFYDKVTAKSIAPIHSSSLRIEANDDSEVFLSLDTQKLTGITNGKATMELHTNSKEVFYQINENSEIKGIITADSLKIDMYQKGYAKLEGEVVSMLVRADNNADFYGEKLKAGKSKIVAEASSDCYILTTNQITIEAKDETEIYLLGDPKITITTFANEATLYKKKINYSPSRLKLN